MVTPSDIAPAAKAVARSAAAVLQAIPAPISIGAIGLTRIAEPRCRERRAKIRNESLDHGPRLILLMLVFNTVNHRSASTHVSDRINLSLTM